MALTRRAALRATLVIAGLVGIVGSCGGESTKEKPFTEEQVQLVANAFFRNHDAKGISFTLSTPGEGGAGTLVIQGDVDFVKLIGGARVIGGSNPHPVTRVFWAGSTVVEGRPTLRGSLDALGYTGVNYVAREIDLKARRLDVLLSAVMGMGMEQPENAVLVRQKEGSAHLRDDELRGTKVQVLRYGDRLALWIDPVTGDLLRFEGTNAARTFPIIIDILSKGPRSIDGPLKSEVVDATKLGESYAEWAPQSP